MILTGTRAVIASVSGAPGRLKIDLEQDLCFTAGLIHDSGKRTMAIYHPEILKEIMKVSGKNKWTLGAVKRSWIFLCLTLPYR